MTLLALLPRHWKEYAIEGWALGCFMLVACGATALVLHPDSPLAGIIPPVPLAQRAVLGVWMGLTLIALVYSPWGRISGAHMNPAFTLTFAGLRKIAPRDAVGYIAAQLIGGIAGVALARLLIGDALRHPRVHFAVTQPGVGGVWPAVGGELLISFLQMSLVLRVMASHRWRALTGVFAALGVAFYITFEAPLSGMSMNPARSLGSAVMAQSWTGIWIYLIAPPAGMLLAAAFVFRRAGASAAACGKMMHATPCLFCEHVATQATPSPPHGNTR